MTDLVLDASSLFARSFFAAQNSRYNTDIATDAPALTYALRTLIRLLDPGSDSIGTVIDRMLAAWDGEQNPHKDRKPKPAEYHDMKLRFQDLFSVMFGATQLIAAPGSEADDVVASAVAQSPAERVYVVSGDKDLTQLHCPRVSFYDLNQKCLLSPHLICSRWGIKDPSHVSLALAIIGDPVDNIRGIPGWGAKKARKLFEVVPDGAPLDEALNLLLPQIPEHLADAFWNSLDRTLLKPDLPLEAGPSKIVYTSVDEVADLGLGIESDYARLLSSLEASTGSRSATNRPRSGSRTASR